MAIELACPKCQKRLKAPLGSEGKKVKCPQCQEIVIVPGAAASGGGSASASAATASSASVSSASVGPANAAMPSAPAAAAERWYVKTRAGADYGPITKAEMNLWVGQQRLDSESQVLREGASQWQWASDLYPQLAPAAGEPRAAAAAPTNYPAPPEPRAEPIAATGVFDNAAAEQLAAEQPAAAQPSVPAFFTPPASAPVEASFSLPTSGAITNSGSQSNINLPGFGVGYVPQKPPSDKSKTIAGVLGIVVGGFGVHRFYLGYIGIGVAQVVVTIATCGIGAWWGFIEGIMILTGQIDRDAQGRKLRD